MTIAELIGFMFGTALGVLLWPLVYWFIGVLFWLTVGAMLACAAGVGRLQRDPLARRRRVRERLRRSVRRGYDHKLVPMLDLRGGVRDFYCWRCLKPSPGVMACHVLEIGLWRTICKECFETFYLHEERVP